MSLHACAADVQSNQSASRRVDELPNGYLEIMIRQGVRSCDRVGFGLRVGKRRK